MSVKYRLWIIGVATIVVSGPAFAADLPTTKAPPSFAPAPVFSWTGFYFGGNVGYGWGSANDREVPAPDQPADADFTVGINPAGALGGVGAGYNWQSGAFVIGAEADFDFSGISRNARLSGLPIAGTGGVIDPAWYSSASENVQSLGTLRLRAGVAVDRALFYATGGLAYGDVRYSSLTQYNGPGAEYVGSASAWKVGWALGGGVEYALTNNWTIKGEYLYYHLGNQSYLAQPVEANPPNIVGHTFSTNGDIVRVGVNYKF
jgi:outer membrane immunogenic protein